jgi:beta-lactamase class A
MTPPEQGDERAEFARFALNQSTAVDPILQDNLARLDEALRSKYGMDQWQTVVGVVDLKKPRAALLRPDEMMYGASIPKIGILLAFFQRHPEVAANPPPATFRELGLMIKQSSNEMASKFSHQLGLAAIQQVLNSYGFYDPDRGGGIWMGKHYGENTERIGDPISDHSHAVTVRQLLRFYMLLEQGKLISTEASARMRQIFDSPDIPHDSIKFVKGLEGRPVELRRKWGSWENWLHDSAVVHGAGRYYILVGLTNHARGDQYLADLATAVDNWMQL